MEGDYGREVGDEVLDSNNPTNRAVNSAMDKAVDKAVDKVMDKRFGDKGKNPLDKGNKGSIFGGGKNNPNKVADAADKARKRGAGAAKGAEAAGNAAKGMASGSGGISDAAVDKAVDALTGPREDDSKTGGEAINNMADGAKKAAKAAVAVGRLAASGGTDAAAWVDALKIIGKLVVKILFIILGVIFGLIFLIIFALKELLGNVISDAITFISEGFQNIANSLNPTVIDNFTMEDQYEILANAFGDEVLLAYKQMLDSVDKEIDKYNKNNNLTTNGDYNSWRLGLEYSKANGLISYNHIVERTDEIKISERYFCVKKSGLVSGFINAAFD